MNLSRPRRTWCNLLLGIVIALVVEILLSPASVTALPVKKLKEYYVPDYGVYHNLSAINTIVDEYASVYKGKFVEPLESVLGKDLLQTEGGGVIKGLRITDLSTGGSQGEKKKIIMVFGTHAREFLPVEAMINLLGVLLEQPVKSGQGKRREEELFSNTLRMNREHILQKLDLYAVVMLNPDGRKKLEETENYCWRGNGAGVDIDRNFDWGFSSKEQFGNPEDEEFAGKIPFSEKESVFVKKLGEKVGPDAFFSFHSGAQLIIYPFADKGSFDKGNKPKHWEKSSKFGNGIAQYIQQKRSQSYGTGTLPKVLNYTAGGTSFDYMSGALSVPLSFTVEIFDRDKFYKLNAKEKAPLCFDLFNPKSEDLGVALMDASYLFEGLFMELLSDDFEEAVIDGKTHNADMRMTPSSTNSLFPAHGIFLSGRRILFIVWVTCFGIIAFASRRVLFAKWKRISRRRIRVINLNNLNSM